MSLQVWLPLNGDLTQQGVSVAQAINSGATVDNNGKIGKCYSFDGTDDFLTLTGITCSGWSAFSLTCWCYFSSTSNNLFLIRGSGAHRIRLSESFSFRDSNNSSLRSIGFGQTLPINTWYHIACIYNHGEIFIYINGMLTNHVISYYHSDSVFLSDHNEIRIARQTSSSGSSYYDGKINDFRIYDHALSAKEVKEISKGLVLHYKLDDQYLEASSFLSSEISNTAYNAANGKYGYNETSNLAKVSGFFQGKNCIKVYTLEDGQAARPYVYFSNLYTSDGTNSPAYKALSFDYYTTVPTTTLLNIYKLGNGSGTATWTTINSDGKFTGTYTNSSQAIKVKPNEWNHIEIILHGTTVEDARWGYCINGNQYTSSQDYYFLYANIQLEVNDHVTGYNSAFHKNIVYDSSGYGYHAVQTGTLVTTNLSPRYSAAISFNGSSCIKTNNFNLPGKIWSVTCWYYKPTNPTGYEGLFCLSKGNGADANKKFAAMPNAGRIWYKGESGSSSISKLKLAEWTFLAITCDGITVKVYENEEQIGSFNAGDEITDANDLVIGARSSATDATSTSVYFTGQMSDFRIYATALSADDILDLYHTSASIDKGYNGYGRSIIEQGQNLMQKPNFALANNTLDGTVGLQRYQQTNCLVTIENNKIHIYRPPNLTQSNDGNTMYGGVRIRNSSNGGVHQYNATTDNIFNLQKGHTYIWIFHVSGNTTQAPSFQVNNNMGWGGGGLTPSPSNVISKNISTNFSGEQDVYYKFTINDEIVKTCTTAYSSFVLDGNYLSYMDFGWNWSYGSTGNGTDIYVDNIRLYDITNMPNTGQITKQGIMNFTSFYELDNLAKILTSKDIEVNQIIEY